MSAWSWTPDFGANKKNTNKVVEAKFGDGYSQRQSVGMNPQAQVWTLTFANRSSADATDMDNFLTARGGVEAFDFTPPNAGSSIRVVCRDGNWSVTTVKYNLYSISAKFEQVFEP